MISFYRTKNNSTLDELHMCENVLLENFKKEFLSTYSEFLLEHKIHSEIRLYRWTDTATRWLRKENDGYSAMIQVDLLNDDNSKVELDESVCSCFLIITYVAFYPIRRRYRVFQADDLGELWDEIRHLIHMLNGSSTLFLDINVYFQQSSPM